MADEEKAVVVDPENLTDEQEAEITRMYLAGEIDEDGKPTDKAKLEEKSEEESKDESDKEPSGEGPAIKENKRLREARREDQLRIEELQRKFEELSKKVEAGDKPESKGSPWEEKLKAASVDDLIATETQIDVKLLKAYQDEDTDAIKQLSDVKQAVKSELFKRPGLQAKKDNEETVAKTQWSNLEKAVLEAVPEITDVSSDIYKKAEKYAQDNPELMKSLGAAGGLVATAQALLLSKPKTQEGKKAVKDVASQMEKITEQTVSKTGSTSTPENVGKVNFNAMSDEDFERIYDEMKAGRRPVPTTG